MASQPPSQPLPKHRSRSLPACFLAGGFVFFLWWIGVLERLENSVRDRYVAATMETLDTNFTLIEIDAQSIETVGRWPWPRRLYAQALERLGEAGVRSVLVDIDLSARSRNQDDVLLASALARLSETVAVRLPIFLQPRSHAEQALMVRAALPMLAAHTDAVAVNMRPERDGLVRFLAPGFTWRDQLYSSAWNVMADAPGQATWIDYRIAPASFDYFSFEDLLAGRIPARQLAGRDIIIGSTAIELGDNIATPIHQSLPGAVVQALGAETLKRGGLYRLGEPVMVILLGLAWLAATFLSIRLSWSRGLQALVLATALLLGVAIGAYRLGGLMVDLAAPLLLWTLVYIAANLARLDSISLERLWLLVSLKDREALFDRIVDTANDSILCADGNGVITRVNPVAQRLLDRPAESLLGQNLAGWLPDAHRGLASLPQRPFDTVLLSRDGREIPVEATISQVDSASEPVYTLILRDLSDRVAREQELQFQASHDSLTGLLNRAALFAHIHTSLKRQPRGCLLCLDLDYFHEVNDAYGHASGDRLLQAVAQRLQTLVADRGLAARVGGNDFALWLPGASFAGAGQAFCRQLQEILDPPFLLDPADDLRLQISGTIGAAETGGSGSSDQSLPLPQFKPQPPEPVVDSAESLLRKATDAMRLAKSQGLELHCFSAADQQAAVRRLEMVPAIRIAIRDNALRLAYQPKINLQTLGVSGCEVLLRWPQGRNAYVPIGTLIEVAENSRQIAPLTRWVVETLLASEADWAAKKMPAHMAVNLSARLLQDRNFIAGLKDLLSSSSGYYHFELEITETALVGNTDQALQTVGELLACGATLAIDDYGTGYSSLAYLRDLRASVLKIDRCFVTDINTQPGNQVIVQSTVRMAHDLGMSVVAEGIETLADQQFLRRIGCDTGQGFYYSRPLRRLEFERWLAARLPAASAGASSL